jgi:hypothetical protein
MAMTEAEKLARREAREGAQRSHQERQARKEAALESRYRDRYARHRAWEAQIDALRDLVPKALAVLGEALDDKGDEKQRAIVALAVLRAAGLNGLAPPDKPDRARLRYEDVEPELEG